jgi:hypothetical protein
MNQISGTSLKQAIVPIGAKPRSPRAGRAPVSDLYFHQGCHALPYFSADATDDLDKRPRNGLFSTAQRQCEGGGMDAHETQEQIEQANHLSNRRAALLIAALAAMLAITEMAAKHAQNESVTNNIKASDTWAFYQAKTIRGTTLRTAVEAAALQPGVDPAARDKQVATWKATADRYDSDPATGEGRKELSALATATEEKRDHELSAFHAFEYGAGALQLAIVMASAAVITGMLALELVAAGLGVLGVAFAALGWWAPALLHL